MFRPILLTVAITVSLFCPFSKGKNTQESFLFSSRNSSYLPGSETEDVLLGDKKSATWCAVRCLGSPNCLAMDVCFLQTSTRCRMWRTQPKDDSTKKKICRRFYEVISSTTNNSTPLPLDTTTQTQNLPLNQDTVTKDTTSAAISECKNGCSCSVVTDQFFTGKELYSVTLNGNSTTYACRLGENGRMWTIIQRRTDGSVNFHQKLWTDYEKGFGLISNEFWIGLWEIHRLTSLGRTALWIKLEFSDNTVLHAKYSNFTVGGPDTNYRLHIGGYSGNAGDNFISSDPEVNLNGMMFTTSDNDNDLYSGGNCAVHYHGAWWYKNCAFSNLNGWYTDADFAWGLHVSKLTKTLMLITFL